MTSNSTPDKTLAQAEELLRKLNRELTRAETGKS